MNTHKDACHLEASWKPLGGHLEDIFSSNFLVMENCLETSGKNTFDGKTDIKSTVIHHLASVNLEVPFILLISISGLDI